jgi:hypothetical protein
VKLSLCLPKHYAMKTYAYLIKHHAMMPQGGMEVKLHALLTSAPDGGGWSTSRPGRLTPGTRWIGGYVGPRTGLDAVTKGKKSHYCPYREQNAGHPARNLVSCSIYYAQCYFLWLMYKLHTALRTEVNLPVFLRTTPL